MGHHPLLVILGNTEWPYPWRNQQEFRVHLIPHRSGLKREQTIPSSPEKWANPASRCTFSTAVPEYPTSARSLSLQTRQDSNRHQQRPLRSPFRRFSRPPSCAFRLRHADLSSRPEISCRFAGCRNGIRNIVKFQIEKDLKAHCRQRFHKCRSRRVNISFPTLSRHSEGSSCEIRSRAGSLEEKSSATMIRGFLSIIFIIFHILLIVITLINHKQALAVVMNMLDSNLRRPMYRLDPAPGFTAWALPMQRLGHKPAMSALIPRPTRQQLFQQLPEQLQHISC